MVSGASGELDDQLNGRHRCPEWPAERAEITLPNPSPIMAIRVTVSWRFLGTQLQSEARFADSRRRPLGKGSRSYEEPPTPQERFHDCIG